MRFFKVELPGLNVIREQVMAALEQPNGRADEPWPLDGSFQYNGYGYVALGDHHTTGEFQPLLDQFLTAEGVQEISEEDYQAAQAIE